MKVNARGEKMVPKVGGSGGGPDGDKGSLMLVNENKKLENLIKNGFLPHIKEGHLKHAQTNSDIQRHIAT